MRIAIHPVAPTLLETAPVVAETAARMLKIRILRFAPRSRARH
jgi:hypothetical protein